MPLRHVSPSWTDTGQLLEALPYLVLFLDDVPVDKGIILGLIAIGGNLVMIAGVAYAYKWVRSGGAGSAQQAATPDASGPSGQQPAGRGQEQPPAGTQPQQPPAQQLPSPSSDSRPESSPEAPSAQPPPSRFVREPAPIRMSDVHCHQEAVAQLEEQVFRPMCEPEYREQGYSPPTGVLITGKEDTGKTHLARAFAGTLWDDYNVTYLEASSADLIEATIGANSSNVRELFQVAAAHQPAIILLDDASDLLGQRTGRHNQHQVHERAVNELLRCLDQLAHADAAVTVIATTTDPDAIDDQFTNSRRFGVEIECDLLRRPEIKAEVLKAELEATAPDVAMEEIDWHRLGEQIRDVPVGTLVEVADRAGKRVVMEDRPVEQADIEAVMDEMRGIRRRL